jgi:hypothetical protein
MERLLVRMEAPIRRVPQIEEKIDDVVERVIRFEEKSQVNKESVEKLEKRVQEESGRPYECSQLATIKELRDGQKETAVKLELEVQENVGQAAKLDTVVKDISSVETDVTEIKRVPQRMFYGLIGVIITILVGAGGSVWFLAELNKDVEFERTRRAEQYKQIEVQIRSVASKAGTRAAPRLEKQMITDALQAAVSAGSDSEYNAMCRSMSLREKRVLHAMLIRQGKRVPTSCLDP